MSFAKNDGSVQSETDHGVAGTAVTPNLDEEHMVWIDTETTGLDPDSDLLLEIAVVVTDKNLNPVAEMEALIQQDRTSALERIESVPQVLLMHDRSGLLPLIGSGDPVEDVERSVIDFVLQHCHGKPVVAGSSIGFDRGFLSRYMPHLNEEVLHYRSVDVSTVKELARRYAPEVLQDAPKKLRSHRALDDIRESIAELRHYIESGLLDRTTPEEVMARVISEHVLVDDGVCECGDWLGGLADNAKVAIGRHVAAKIVDEAESIMLA